MDLIKHYRKKYLELHSKGIWITKEGERIFVEDLTDKHLMRIPYFLYKKGRVEIISDLPYCIRKEVHKRGMIIDDHFIVSYKEDVHKAKKKMYISKKNIRQPWR